MTKCLEKRRIFLKRASKRRKQHQLDLQQNTKRAKQSTQKTTPHQHQDQNTSKNQPINRTTIRGIQTYFWALFFLGLSLFLGITKSWHSLTLASASIIALSFLTFSPKNLPTSQEISASTKSSTSGITSYHHLYTVMMLVPTEGFGEPSLWN